MTDNQKKNYSDNLAFIKQKIKTCFGENDLKFALNPLAEDSANKIKEFASVNGIELSDAQNIAFGFLHRNKCTSEHIKEQGIKVIEFFS